MLNLIANISKEKSWYAKDVHPITNTLWCHWIPLANTYLSLPLNFNRPIIYGTVKSPSEACQLKQKIDAVEEEKDHFHTQRPPITELKQTKDQKSH